MLATCRGTYLFCPRVFVGSSRIFPKSKIPANDLQTLINIWFSTCGNWNVFIFSTWMKNTCKCSIEPFLFSIPYLETKKQNSGFCCLNDSSRNIYKTCVQHWQTIGSVRKQSLLNMFGMCPLSFTACFSFFCASFLTQDPSLTFPVSMLTIV